MPSVHRKRKSPFWYCAYQLPDGRRTLRSTGCQNKVKAFRVCLRLAEEAKAASEGRYAESRARRAIGDIVRIVSGASLPSAKISDYLEGWIERRRPELAESSFTEYQRVIGEFLKFLGAKSARQMEGVGLIDLTEFRDSVLGRVAGSTAKKYLKILRAAWSDAYRDGIVSENPFLRLSKIKSKPQTRRPFKLDELKKILAECDQEWRGIVLFGVYTGQRLGDIASLTWRNVDLEADEIRFATRKTSRSMALPIATPLREYLVELEAPDDPNAPLFPRAFSAAEKHVGTLSNQFSDILAAAGIIKRKAHRTQEKGRDVRRDIGGPSFHALRHTATSLLKNCGVSDVVARELIGHESEAVSRIYTHIEPAALKRAISKLPDITKQTKGK